MRREKLVTLSRILDPGLVGLLLVLVRISSAAPHLTLRPLKRRWHQRMCSLGLGLQDAKPTEALRLQAPKP